MHKEAPHLHAVVLIIHILNPGDKLPSIEAISHRLVFIPLENTISYRCKKIYAERLLTSLVC